METLPEELIREGTLVDPKDRISQKQIEILHKSSMEILTDPGVLCFNEKAAEILNDAGCDVKPAGKEQPAWIVKIPEKVVQQAIESLPGKIVLGARDPAKKLVIDSRVPRVYFGTGSETNIYLVAEEAEYQKVGEESKIKKLVDFKKERGSLANLCQSAKLCNALSNADFFIRNVNIQDEDIPPQHKDVNVFAASLLYMTKHVQAGLARVEKLDEVVKLAAIMAGGEEQLIDNPLISFITCVIKSPLQMLEDSAEKLIEICSRGLPLVISSSPQGGSTAPISEQGMVALINAEILAGITLAQAVKPGTPVLYGAVPVRAHTDTLHDLYGAPEFIHYNIDCVQMARHYGIPCYSSAGVGDAKQPGMQATVEKLFAQLAVASSGAQYIHYAIGLLDKTNIFCPLQAVLDDTHLGIVREILRQPEFDEEDADDAVKQVRKVMNSSTKLFAKYIRKAIRAGVVSETYPFESSSDEDEVLIKANTRLKEIITGPDEKPDQAIIDKLFSEIEGLMPIERFEV